MRFNALLMHYGEIALKGKNRSLFEDKLVENIRIALGRDVPPYRIQQMHGRVVISFGEEVDAEAFVLRVQRVFGLANVAAAVKVDPDIDAMRKAALELAGQKSFESFAVRAHRSEKSIPLSSQAINVDIGAAVQKASGARVQLDNPELTIGIEILTRHAYLFAGRAACAGGLPVGMSGKAACLISGGIDSPVAAWRMMKRGCAPLFIHFHSAPFTSAQSQEKVEQIVDRLVRGQPRATLLMVPFGSVQKKIVIGVPAKYRVVLYRRFMLRIACALAKERKATALVSGEALGQVASQTLSNMATIDAASELPILRPLIGYDKQEIVDLARSIGTYDISIRPHDDCCSFLMPRNPITRSTPRELERVERAFDVGSLVRLACDECKEIEIDGGQLDAV